MARTKKANKEPKIKEPVRIRYKSLANGNKSIYLDYYLNGIREYEFLKLYLIPEKTPADKIANEQTISTANAVKAKRIVEIQNEMHGFKITATRKKTNLCAYVEKMANEQLAKTGIKRSNYQHFLQLKNHLILYKGDKIDFSKVDEAYIKGFIAYLKTAKNLNFKKGEAPTIIAKNTQLKMFNKLSYILQQAERAGILVKNPAKLIERNDKPKAMESKREYLTIDELKKLIQARCSNDNLKSAFLFCCLTGLRFSDVKKITWGDFHTDNNGETELQFRMQKTKGQMYLQVSNEALKWLPERGNAGNDALVYTPLPRNDHANETLKRWVTAAGITKPVTFHCSRHTAATLNLSLGVPLEIVSKLLGHTKITTTQIYAKIVNEARRAAVDKQNGIFG
jgi:integrase